MVYAHEAERLEGFASGRKRARGALAQWLGCAGGRARAGFFAIELARVGNFNITGLDISHTLVEVAAENARNAGLKIDFRWGSASAIPFPNESFDFIYCSAAFKNFSEPVKALDEMYRVLRPGGEALVADLRKDAPPR